MPPLKGTYASKVLSFQRDHPLKTNGGAVGAVYKLPKKGGSLIPPHTTHCPFTEEAIKGLRGIHLLVVAVTTKRLLRSASQEKAEVPPSALFDAFISYG